MNRLQPLSGAVAGAHRPSKRAGVTEGPNTAATEAPDVRGSIPGRSITDRSIPGVSISGSRVQAVPTRKPSLRLVDGGGPDDGFSAGSRHGWLAEMCGYLAASIWARDASELLVEADSLPENAALVLLPVWRWALGGPSTGRKSKARGGGSLMLPTRIDWHGSSVVLATADSPVQRSWSAAGIDTGGTGTCQIAVGANSESSVTEELRDHFTGAAMPRRRLVLALEHLVVTGRAARWNAIQKLEPAVNHAVEMAHRQVAYEIAGNVPGAPPVVDLHNLEAIKQQMLLGVDEHTCGSVARLWTRMERPTCFARADPMLYVKTNLHRDATEGVRRHIGDPKIGAKVRRAYALSSAASLAEFVTEYRAQFPSDKLSFDRARASLTTRGLRPSWLDLQSGDAVIAELDSDRESLWR